MRRRQPKDEPKRNAADVDPCKTETVRIEGLPEIDGTIEMIDRLLEGKAPQVKPCPRCGKYH